MTCDLKDDWKLDVEPKPLPKVVIPTFIRLFVMKRVLLKCITDSTKKERCKKLRELLSDAYGHINYDEQKKRIQTAYGILNELVNGSFIRYLNHTFTIENINIIEDIFNQVILTQCRVEFDEITTYGSSNNENNNNNMNKNRLFNTSDLMNSIFHFLGSFDEFDKCSLVCSHWLYYAMNPNSTIFTRFNLFSFIEKFDENDKTKAKKATRLWQRYINVKSLYCDMNSDAARRHERGVGHLPGLSLLCRHILTLNNVNEIEGHVHSKLMPLAKAIMYQGHHKIEN